MRKLYYLGMLTLSVACSPDSRDLNSPNEALNLQFRTNEPGCFTYLLTQGQDTLIRESKLGFVINDNDSLCRNLQIRHVAYHQERSVWHQPWGENKEVTNHYNEAVVTLEYQPSALQYKVHFRLFDDGLAFRYEFPEGFAADTTVIRDEITEFNIAGNPTTWWSYADFNTYEKTFMTTPLDSVSWAATPFTMRTENGKHLFIHEAAISKYPDMTVKNKGGGIYKCELTPWKNGDKAYVSAPFQTPWRMIVTGDEAKDLVSSQMMVNLNEPSKIKDTSWISPMSYMGIWWEMHLGSKVWKEGAFQAATTSEAKRYIDFAASNGIRGLVIEGWNTGWDKWGEKDAFDYVTSAQGYDLEEVAAYASEKNVSLIMHHETGADIESYEALMDSAFSLCKRLGIHAVKTGHAGGVSTGENHHGQQMVEHFQRIVEKAAQYELMLDLHEPTKGSGINRTWPNLMTREAVRGMEWEAWSVGNTPRHTTTIPYTRGLAGPTDYTPGIIDVLLLSKKQERTQWNDQLKDISKTRVHSTLCHQLALLVTIYSPLQMASDLPENYATHPAFQFIRDFDADCDESVVLNGEVGEYITIARRAGEKWMLGATTNEEERTLTIPLSFLKKGDYRATLYQDGADAHWEHNPVSYEIVERAVSETDTLTIRLAAGGGVGVIFKPIAE